MPHMEVASMLKIAIVTDSTADMPLSFYEENDVTMVPLIVRFGNEAFKDWVEMAPKEFYKKLVAASEPPKTSQPSVQDFIEAYEKHSDCDHIISVHLSSQLSGTYQSAYIAAQNVDTPVTVIDSKLASIGTAIIVKELLAARHEGKSVEEMLDIANRLIDSVQILFCVDTLKYLEMGGRIGKASALIGSILNIKLVLTLDDGVVAPLKKVKGRKKLFKEIIALLKESGDERLNIGLVHADAKDSLSELHTSINNEEIDYNLIIEAEIGSVIGTYTGPGTFAVAYYPVSMRQRPERQHIDGKGTCCARD